MTAPDAAPVISLSGENKPDEEELRAKFLDHFDASYDKGKVTTRVADWVAAEVGGLSSNPS